MWRRLLILLAALTAAPTGAAELSAADQADIARAEAYLNGITTVRARFVQESSRGAAASGTFYLQRPGRLRIDYTPPAKMQIYASQGLLVYFDTELEDSTYVPLSATPAGLLVRENVRLSGEVTVTRVERGPQILRIELVQTKEPEAGRVTLVFSDRPLELRQWQVVDAQGVTTTVSLLDTEFGVRIDPRVFVFQDPKFARPPER